jgi:hypothetical protein
LTFGVLTLSGLLLFVPGLRAVVSGSYSPLLRDVHRWGGVAFVVLPVALVVACGPGNVFVAPALRSLQTAWQSLHMSITVLIGVAFALTGVAIWAKRVLAEAVIDGTSD